MRRLGWVLMVLALPVALAVQVSFLVGSGATTPSLEPVAERGSGFETIDLTTQRLYGVQPVSLEGYEVGGDDRSVRLDYLGGTRDCFGPARAEIAYRFRYVVVRILEGRIHRGLCPLPLQLHSVRLRLSQPLEGRPIKGSGTTEEI